MTDTISFTQQQGVATLCFDNPSRRNALGAAELDAIEHALGSLSAETRVLVVTSSDDRIFCAGADLSQILDGSLNGDHRLDCHRESATDPHPRKKYDHPRTSPPTPSSPPTVNQGRVRLRQAPPHPRRCGARGCRSTAWRRPAVV